MNISDGVQMESSLLNNRWSPLAPGGSSGLHVDYGQ